MIFPNIFEFPSFSKLLGFGRAIVPCLPASYAYAVARDLTILGRQINGSKDNLRYIVNRMNLIHAVLEHGFMFGKSSAEPSLKLHLIVAA